MTMISIISPYIQANFSIIFKITKKSQQKLALLKIYKIFANMESILIIFTLGAMI